MLTVPNNNMRTQRNADSHRLKPYDKDLETKLLNVGMVEGGADPTRCRQPNSKLDEQHNHRGIDGKIYRERVCMHIYFRYADDRHRPISLILFSAMPSEAAEVAAPMRKLWPL